MRWYTEYDAAIEEILANGTSAHCAKVLGLTLDSFYCAVTRSRTGTQNKYEFVVEEIKKEQLQ